MIFNKNKKAQVVYSFDKNYSFPTSIFADPYPYNTNNHGCPAVHVSNHRLYAVNGPLDVKFTYNPKTKNVDYVKTSSNTADKLGKDLFNYINFTEQDINGVTTLQAMIPYVFFTDTEGIELSLLPGTDLDMNNCRFISGSFNIYNWNRTLNFALEVIDKTKEVTFQWNVDKPFMFIYFNKAVNVNYKLMTDEMWAMCMEVKNITKLRNNTTKIYNTVLKRRPKNLL